MKFSELIGESNQYLGEGGEMNHSYVSFLPHMEVSCLHLYTTLGSAVVWI